MKYINQLKDIMKASGWTQQQLALRLGVSFASLNAWLRQRARPHQRHLDVIEAVYFEVIGAPSVDQAELTAAKAAIAGFKFTPKRILANDQLRDQLILYLTYHTNTIEGSTMTLVDVREVVFEHRVLANRTATEQLEATNHQAALLWLLEKMARQGSTFRIDIELILGLHLRLMNGIISDAGRFRRHNVRIMGAHVTLANWARVSTLMEEFVRGLAATGEDITAELAASHARFEQIHPFSDGNGRLGRLLMLAQALRVSMVPPIVLKERKVAYYRYLQIAQNEGDGRLLELFLAQSIAESHRLLGL